MSDIWTGWDASAGYGDWAISPTVTSLWVDDAGNPIVDQNGQPIDAVVDPAARYSQTGDLITAVLISLFTDAAASPDDVIPDGTTNRRGWWGGQIGSKLWLLDRSKALPTLPAQARSYIEQALAWLVSDGVAQAITVTAQYLTPSSLGAQIVISQGQGTNLAVNFSQLWEGL